VTPPPRFAQGQARRWILTAPLVWELGSKGSGHLITIPIATEFESSVPWGLRWFVSPDDPRFLLAALVHDYMLESGRFGRLQAAAEWFDGAMAGGAPRAKAKALYVGISIYAVLRMRPDQERITAPDL
jgi:hypothetical protein